MTSRSKLGSNTKFEITKCPHCGAMAVIFTDPSAHAEAYAELARRFGDRFSMVNTRPNHDWPKGKVIWHIIFHEKKERHA